MPGMSRRAILAGAGGVCVVAGVAGAASLVACSNARVAALEGLDVALPGIPGVERIARAYRAAREPERLVSELSGKEGLMDALSIDCPASRAAALRAEMQADFRAGDVVVADRLVVSRTECLIAALRHGTPGVPA